MKDLTLDQDKEIKLRKRKSSKTRKFSAEQIQELFEVIKTFYIFCTRDERDSFVSFGRSYYKMCKSLRARLVLKEVISKSCAADWDVQTAGQLLETAGGPAAATDGLVAGTDRRRKLGTLKTDRRRKAGTLETPSSGRGIRHSVSVSILYLGSNRSEFYQY